MEPFTTWFYRQRLRLDSAIRQLRVLNEVQDKVDAADDIEATEEPEEETGGGTEEEPFTGLPADDILGFEKSSYSFTIDASGEGNPYGDLGLGIGVVRARTAAWEAPTRYWLEGDPTIPEGRFGVHSDGIVAWVGDTYPGSISDAIRTNDWTNYNPANVNQSGGTYTFKVKAELRGQVAETNVTVDLLVVDIFRTRNTLAFNSSTGDTSSEAHWTVAGLPVGSQHAGWTYAVPSPIPLPDANLRAVWAALQGLGNLFFDVGRAFINTIRNLNPFSSNDEDTTVEWKNPFSARDMPTNAQVGGVIIRPGFIPLKNITAHKVDISGIREVSARLVRDRDAATRENTETAPEKLEVVIRPYGAEIVSGPNVQSPLNVNNLREDFGLCVIWYPRAAHQKHILDNMELTIEDVNGVEEVFNFPIQSRNMNSYREDLGFTGVDVPETGACTLGWADNTIPFFPNGVFESERNLVHDSDYNEMLIAMPFTLCERTDTVGTSFERAVEAGRRQITSHTDLRRYQRIGQFFVTRLHQRLGILDTAKGSAFQFFITGKIVGWQLSWATATDTGSIYLWPNTWASDFLGSTLGLVTNFGYQPTGTKYSGSVPSGLTQQDVALDDNPNFVSFGPHLEIQGNQHGFFKLRSTNSPGSTIIQVRPYVHEWIALSIPLPVGVVSKWVTGAILNVAARFGLRRTPEILQRTARIAQLNAVNNVLRGGLTGAHFRRVLRSAKSTRYLSLYFQTEFRDQIPWFSNAVFRLHTFLVASPRRFRRAIGATGLRRPPPGGLAPYVWRSNRAYQASIITANAWIRNANSVVRQATLAQQAYDREQAIVQTRFNRVSWEGFYFPPFVTNVVWTGDYICGRVNTLPQGTDVTDSDRLATGIDLQAIIDPPSTGASS